MAIATAEEAVTPTPENPTQAISSFLSSWQNLQEAELHKFNIGVATVSALATGLVGYLTSNPEASLLTGLFAGLVILKTDQTVSRTLSQRDP